VTPPVRPVGLHRSRVEWIDTDAAGIYHNSAVLRFVEAAEATLITERGLAGYWPAAPRVRYEVDFEAPLFFGQEVTTTVALARLGSSSMTFEFEVWGEAHLERPRIRAARGSYVTVHIEGGYDPRGFRPVSAAPWPDAWVEALSARPR
jgi:acyl-CoA thioester hydrolase